MKIDRLDLHLAVLATLRATNFRVGYVAAPLGQGYPYGVLQPIDGGTYEMATLNDDQEGQSHPFQLTAVGEEQEQTQELMDRLIQRVLGTNPDGSWAYDITPAQSRVVKRRGRSAGTLRPEGRLFNAWEIFYLTAVPLGV